MSLSEYLAKNYLNADPGTDKRSKKRKRKEHSVPSLGIVIADDDAPWNALTNHGEQENEPTIVSGDSSEFRKSRKSNWKTVGAPAPSNADQAAADAIIASAAAENNARNEIDEDGPQVVGDVEGNLQMESGAHAGLQTADQVTTALERRKAEERRRFEESDVQLSGKGQETIYRDASGRIINIAMKRAEARKKAEDEENQKAADLEVMKGDVQRSQREQRKEQLADAKFLSVARYADDEDLNDELKERERWNDPAAQFLTKKPAKQSVTGKPLYKGAAPPNRYGIRPGHRWDGVDRSNGFEKEYFAAQNRRANVRDLQYAWQMDE